MLYLDVVKMMMMWQVTWRLIGRCDKWHDLIRSKLKVKLIKIDVVATFEPFCNWWVLYLKLKIVILCWVNFTNTWVLNLNLKFFHICGDDVVMTWQVTWPNWVMWQVTCHTRVKLNGQTRQNWRFCYIWPNLYLNSARFKLRDSFLCGVYF